MTPLFQVAVIAMGTVGAGAATMSVLNEDIPDLAVPAGAWSDGHELDGRVFEIFGTDVDSGAVLDNLITFRDGTFQSRDCQAYCNFGWTDYETKAVGDVVHFTAHTVCPDAPHTVVWYGTVTGDTVVIDATWTTRRWYWTNQIRIAADGVTVPASEQGTAS